MKAPHRSTAPLSHAACAERPQFMHFAVRHAVSARRLSSEPLNGAVHSVFRHAVNCLMADGRFATVLSSQKPLPPEGILSASEPCAESGSPSRADSHQGLRAVDFLSLGFKTGEPAQLQPGRLLIGRHAFFFSGIPEANVTPRGLFLLTADGFGTENVRRIRIFADALRHRLQTELVRRQLLNGLREEALAGSSQRMRALLAALQQPEHGALEAAALSLAGFGDGLTPSGDDFLTGLMWGARTMQPTDASWQALPGLALLAQTLLFCRSRTTDASAQMLTFAAEGRFVEPIARLADAFPLVSNAAFEAAAAIGHSSGLDALSGVLFGLEAALHTSEHRLRTSRMNAPFY